MFRYLFILIMLLPSFVCATETIKISELGTETAVTNDDYLAFVDNPGGTPVTKKITFENFVLSIAGGDLASYMPLSTFTAAGDIPVGSGSGAVTKISSGASSISTDPGANNTFFGVNNAGMLGFHDSFNPVLVTEPTSDHSYSGTVATFTAGEALVYGDVVNCMRGKGGGSPEPGTTQHACYKYDADLATYKNYPPRAICVAVDGIAQGASGTFLLNGIIRHDGFAEGVTNDQDEGAVVYGSVTAGALELTRPSTSGNMVAILGYIIEEKVLYFNPSPILVEVP